ncbi:MAG: hypothetical protein QOE92_1139, partial [Chloroflexota bacterium]|nr:hypothetical protein [Chloroflexota bacterium]
MAPRRAAPALRPVACALVIAAMLAACDVGSPPPVIPS